MFKHPKTWKKTSSVVALLLAACMILGSMPITAFATEIEAGDSATEEAADTPEGGGTTVLSQRLMKQETAMKYPRMKPQLLL